MVDSIDIELQEQLLPNDTESRNDAPLSPLPSPTSYPQKVQFKDHTIHIDSLDWRESIHLRVQIIFCFGLFTVLGLADQTVGTLLPYLVEHYHTTETTVSVVFMLQFAGYAVAALYNDVLHVKFGRRGAMLFATGCLLVPFTVISMTEILPLFICVYFFYGLGVGLLDSCCNVFLSGIEDNNEIMGLLHGFYGAGSVIAPPVVSLILNHWGYRSYYATLAVLSGCSCAGVWLVFPHETQWKYEYLTTKDQDESTVNGGIFTLLKDKVILCFSAYLFFYIGAELSIGSWLLTYLRKVKGMEQLEASYIVSWFWIGLTCGRMLLGFVTKKFRNEYRANKWYSLISWVSFSAFVVFCLVYSGDHFERLAKVLTFIMGVFIGPLFPTAAVTLLKTLPVHLHVAGSGLVNSLGGMGSAVLPFFVGALARIMGFKFLLIFIDFVLILYCATWLLLPRIAVGVKYDF